MKQIITVGLILLLKIVAHGQNSTEALDRFDSLDLKMERGEITTSEWYHSILEAGYFSEHSNGWVESTERIEVNPDLYKSLAVKSGLVFHIPENYQIIDSLNGNRYILAYLVNLTDSVISVPRIDATIDNMESFLQVNGEWKKAKGNHKSTCGNSYWTQKLEPNSYLLIHIDNHDISLSTIAVKQKVRLTVGGQIIESKEILALLNENQVKRLKQD